MDNKKIAVLLTVFNRCEVTLKGLRSLQRAIDVLGDGYSFEIFMTDDGCTDGTGDVIKEEFPEVHVVRGDGTLFWSGGMRLAWQAAVDLNIDFDGYLWFNDDAELYDDALVTLMKPLFARKTPCIVSGAFCGSDGTVSYGGADVNRQLITPSPSYPSIFYMNGNLVLICKDAFEKIGMIDGHFSHGLGDWDYGLRAKESGLEVVLTDKYVGITDRHDCDLTVWKMKLSLFKRLKKLHSPKYNPLTIYYFNKTHFNTIFAIKELVKNYIYTVFPILLKI
jgi:GT2 family glycosyltransferase